MSFIVFKGWISCPFCSHRFHLGDAPLRMPDGSATEPDERISRHLGIAAPDLPIVHPPPAGALKWLRRRIWADADSVDGPHKVCPNCHLSLPLKISCGEHAGQTVAVIGARSSGKSNYLGVMIRYLRQRYHEEVDLLLRSLETFSVRNNRPISSEEIYQQRYGRRLFDQSTSMAVDQTRSALQNQDIRVPLIYRLETGSLHASFLHPAGRAMDLLLFDAAGEDLANDENAIRFGAFIEAAAGIILLIDPTQVPEVRRRLPPSVRDRLPPPDVGALKIAEQVVSIYEKRRNWGAKSKIPVPVAVTFSKCDLLRGLCDPHVVFGDARHTHGFDADDARFVSDHMQAFIEKHDDSGLSHMLRTKFRDVEFFAVSALGEQPDSDLRLSGVSPRRVADPLLWILWKLGYIRQRTPPR